MATELAKAYEPKDAQQKWLAFWEAKGYFHSEPDPAKKPFTIVIPPPNVTGALHMGHALNCTLQDVLVRWRRMQGYNALWMPGTDHAGIATQAVVERLVQQTEKKTRHDLGREELVKRIWQWKDKYEARILGQLRELGASCDWQRTRFTLDPQCARAVRETFFRMFRDGYIYRGKRLVNWDAQLQTSVADDETENIKQKAKFYYFRYPVQNGPADTLNVVLIATTRPETMLGDNAVAVHPEPTRELEKREQELRAELSKATEKEAKDIKERLDRIEKRKDYLPHLEKLAVMAAAGTTLDLPLVGRSIPLIADRYADPEKGTGAVKITPAHDFNDYQVWQRHPEIGNPINILNPDGTINGNGRGEYKGRAYSYTGQDRFKAREQVVRDLSELDLVEKEEEIENTIPISDRSKTPIEPLLSDQWFVKMGDREDGKPGLAQLAIDAVTSGRVKFFPERYAKTYLDWLGEKRDWCISRQLWWGHRIPVWSKSRTTNEAIAYGISLPGSDSRKSHQEVTAERRGYVADNVQPLSDEEGNIKGSTLLLCIAPGHDDFERAAEKEGFNQDEDVLDTWFSSALWPHSTLGWPEPTPELKYYYPTSVLCTSRDIITLWVARMVLTGRYNVGDIPFRHVYVHPKMLDGFGETMSKSKGNGIDPLDIIDLYGTDALRYGMVNLATETQDSRLPVVNVCPHCGEQVAVKQEHMYMRTKKLTCPKCKQPFRPGGPWPTDDPELKTAKQASDRFELGRNFANKIWNATRFVLQNLDGYTPAAVDPAALPTEDRWIVSRLATTAAALTDALQGYHFADVARLIYEFTWSEFCDWYIEMSKSRRTDPVCQRVLVGVLDGIIRLIHPVMPFVAESLWHALNEAAPVRGLPTPAPAGESVVIAKWPTYPAGLADVGTESRIARMQDLVRGIREVRNRYMIDKALLEVTVKCPAGVAAELNDLSRFVTQLANLKAFACGPDVAKPKQAAGIVRPDFEAYVSLAGLIDPAAEAKKTEKEIADKRKQLAGIQAKLGNASFVDRAPAEVVRQQRELAAELEGQIRSLEANLAELQGA